MKQCSKIDEYYCSDYWNVTKATLKLEGNYNTTIAYPKTTDVTAQFGYDTICYTNNHGALSSGTLGLSQLALLHMHLAHPMVLLGPATTRS